MAINFPNIPTVNQEITVDTTTWIWTGSTWDIKSATPPTVSQDTFRTIAINGQASIIAEQPNDTLTLAAGTGITLTTDNTTDTITISSSGGGGGGSSTLISLSDVQISSPLNGQVLKYNGSKWVNGVDIAGEGGGGSTSFNLINTSVNSKTLRLNANNTDYDVEIEAGTNISLSVTNQKLTINSSLPTLTNTASSLSNGRVKVNLNASGTELSQFTLKPGNNITYQIVNGEIQISASSTSTGNFAIPVNITNSTASSSSMTGALIVAGGVGVSGDINVAGEIYSSSSVVSANQLTNKNYVDNTSLALAVVFGI